MQTRTLVDKLDALLEPERFHDYAPNGLQVEGRPEITRVVTGVTASLALIEAAARLKADAILVHHGWFWKSESRCITGYRRLRAKRMLELDMNLIAYHLPLDAHPELGNNAGIARCLGLDVLGRWGEMMLGWTGEIPGDPITAEAFAERCGAAFRRKPFLVGPSEKKVKRICWCSGAAQGMMEEAVGQGADLYLSGEISEPTVHLAEEYGVPYLACGHHATERFGIEALGRWVAENCGLEVTFVDIDNPV
ncbi:MAG: Nif3-like dinuclear metal center hexameric protein [Sutterellaceae bacterium]|nr:Nif3-like dinuclear metal center hexameric protein [Sutterellaceae bacterium]MDD7441490.1 Nif3-like dinuclear metal center hexameric protein [Sutterellaceae bacterium]